jgi:MFS transporter, OFA family, oxalate/formate antiporter
MPGRSKIYYGWWIVAAAFSIGFYNAGIVIFGFTAFFDPIVNEFGWSYAQVSLAASLRGAETGLVSPILGFFVERWGSRWIFFMSGIFIGLGLILLSQIHSLGGFYGGFAFIAVGVSACSPAVANPIAIHWFRNRLGMAMGILSSASAAGGLMLPIIIKLIDAFGWRQAVFILGIGAILIGIPLSMVIRHKPEQYGYSPDGVPVSKSDANKKQNIRPSAPEPEIGTKQALKSRTFWFLIMGFTFQYVTISAVLAHIMPFLNTVNFSRSTASFFAASIPLISVAGRLASGWISDKMDWKKVVIVSYIVISIGTLLFNYVSISKLWVLVLAIILFSLSYGSNTTLRAISLRNYFGKSRFATIFGFFLGILSLGAILGPFVAGWIYDTWNSYQYAWIFFTAINVVGLILMIVTPQIRTKAPAAVDA